MTVNFHTKDDDMAKAKKAAARSSAKKKPSAKKPAARKAAAAKPASEKAKAEDLIRMPPDKALRDLASDFINGRASIDEITGDLSGAVRELKKKGLHPAAFKDALRTLQRARKDATKISLYLSHRDYYEEVLGVNKLIENEPGLPADGMDQKPAAETVRSAAPGAAQPAPQKATMSDGRPAVDMGGGTVLRPNFASDGDEHLKKLQAESTGPLLGKAH